MSNTLLNLLPKTLLSVAIASVVVGCANTQIANTTGLEQQAKALAQNSEQTPEQALQEAANAIENTRDERFEFFAPLHYRDALAALEKGQQALAKPETKAMALEYAYKVPSLLSAAKDNKVKVQTSLADALEQDQILRGVDSHKVLPDDYQGLIEDLGDLIKVIEGGQLNKAVSAQAGLLEDMIELEIETLKISHLSEAESMLDKAESAGADDFAEVTFEKAENSLEAAHSYVEKNYRNREGVKQQGQDAWNAAAHAYFIGKEAEQLLQLDEEGAEQKALYFESLLARVNQSLKLENLRTVSLYDQSVKLAEAAEKLKWSPKTSGLELVTQQEQIQEAPISPAEPAPVVETVAETFAEAPVETTVENAVEKVVETAPELSPSTVEALGIEEEPLSVDGLAAQTERNAQSEALAEVQESAASEVADAARSSVDPTDSAENAVAQASAEAPVETLAEPVTEAAKEQPEAIVATAEEVVESVSAGADEPPAQ